MSRKLDEDQDLTYVPARMPVQLVVNGDEQGYFPRYDRTWDDLTRLRWKCGVVGQDTGLNVRVAPSPQPDSTYYCLVVGGVVLEFHVR